MCAVEALYLLECFRFRPLLWVLYSVCLELQNKKLKWVSPKRDCISCVLSGI